MKSKILDILEYLMYILIPVLSVIVCLLLRIAQGEKTEEIVFGIMVGIVLDLIYSVILLFIDKLRRSK